MLRLIEGGFYSDKKSSIVKDICSLVEKKKRCYLLVPEQQALTAEKEMVKILPSIAPLYFEVTNFSRFANSAFRTLGGVSRQYVDKARRSVLMWQTLRSLSPTLNMTAGQREINTGTVDRAMSAVTKMQSASVCAEDLLSAGESERLLHDKRLKSKLSDLSRIMALYKETLKEKYNETGDDISLLCALLSENPDYLSGEDIFIEGFTSFTEPQYQLLGILMSRANVHIVLSLPKLLSDSVEYTETRLAEQRLKGIAARKGSEIKLTRIDAPRTDANALIRRVGEMLWQNFLTLDKDEYTEKEKESLRIFEAATPYDMCELLGADIRRRVTLGARYKDFAIICRDAQEYSGILLSALSNYAVPAFVSEGRDIADFEAIKLINSAYKSIFGDFKAQDVLSYAKCSLCGISREACDEFEEYIYTWNLSGRRFYDRVLWNMSPRGLTVTDETDSESLLRINETRNAIIEPLIEFKEEIFALKTVAEQARALFEFLTRIGLEDALERQSEELIKLSEKSLGEDNGRLWKIICESLDMLVDTVGDTEVSCEGFVNLLGIAFSSYTLGKIPSHVDEVTVGSADMIRLSNKKHVYLIGVNSGEFPRTVKDREYFSDREKLTLSELGLSLMPENELEYSKELFSFSRAFSYGNDSVTLIYSKAMRDFSKCECAPVIDRICEIVGRDNIEIKKISSLSALDLIYTEKSALSLLGRLSEREYEALLPLLSEKETGELIRIAGTDIENTNLSLSEKTLKDMYGGDIGLSQSRLERYNSCPLSYFCSYNLGLDNGERAKFDARNIGSFIHSILENFFKEIKEKKIKISSLTDEGLSEMVRRHARSYIKSISSDEGVISSKRAEVMINRLTKTTLPIVEGLCREFSECDYVPTYFELDIGKSKTAISPSAVKYKTDSGKGVYVAGVIDRVDTFKSGEDVYVRVVDYKTGQKEFSPSDIDEGENLQMFLYLKAICDTENKEFRKDIGVEKNGKLIPAGVIYVKTDLSDVNVQSPDAELAYSAFMKKQSRKGMLLDDKTSLAAMNSSYIPVRFTKDGVPDKRTEKNLYTMEGWETLSCKVRDSVLRITDEMISGNISPHPKKKGGRLPCEYCPYKPICRKASVIKS